MIPHMPLFSKKGGRTFEGPTASFGAVRRLGDQRGESLDIDEEVYGLNLNPNCGKIMGDVGQLRQFS